MARAILSGLREHFFDLALRYIVIMNMRLTSLGINVVANVHDLDNIERRLDSMTFARQGADLREALIAG